jgi:serine/threonine protein kinase
VKCSGSTTTQAYHILFGLKETEEEMGIVMELAEGGSLACHRCLGGIRTDFTKQCQHTGYVYSRQVLVMTTQIAAGMDYMYSQGVVHRDINPDNILLSHTAAGAIQIKVADFGVAVLLVVERKVHTNILRRSVPGAKSMAGWPTCGR